MWGIPSVFFNWKGKTPKRLVWYPNQGMLQYDLIGSHEGILGFTKDYNSKGVVASERVSIHILDRERNQNLFTKTHYSLYALTSS